MKKILSIVSFLAIFSLALTSCKDNTDYVAQVNDRYESFLHFYNDLALNPDLSDDEKDQQIDAAFEQFGADVEAIAMKGLKSHNDDSVAVYMIMAMSEFELTDNEGVLGLIESLGPNAQKDERIVALKASCEKLPLAPEGSQFPDFSIVQPDGRTLKLSDFAGKGKYCLVDFWASWCGPCRREIPNIRNAYEKFGPKGLEVVSVAVWDKPEDSAAAAAELGITWHQIVNAQHEPTDLYGIEGIPHIILIGPDGTILKRDLRGKKIQEELSHYLR